KENFRESRLIDDPLSHKCARDLLVKQHVLQPSWNPGLDASKDVPCHSLSSKPVIDETQTIQVDSVHAEAKPQLLSTSCYILNPFHAEQGSDYIELILGNEGTFYRAFIAIGPGQGGELYIDTGGGIPIWNPADRTSTTLLSRNPHYTSKIQKQRKPEQNLVPLPTCFPPLPSALSSFLPRGFCGLQVGKSWPSFSRISRLALAERTLSQATAKSPGTSVLKMTDIVTTLTTIVGLGVQLKDSINQLIGAIGDGSKKNKDEDFTGTRQIDCKIEKASDFELQHALEKCQKAPLTKNMSGMRRWLHRDAIESVLKDVEKHITGCFREFTALTAIRTERKLDNHDVQVDRKLVKVNRKLDELLRRSVRQAPASPRSNAYYTQNITKNRTGVQGRYTTSTLKARLATVRGRGSLDLPRTRGIPTRGFVKPPIGVGSSATRDSSIEDLTFNVHRPSKNPNRRVVKRKPPPFIRSDTTSTSITSASSVSLPSSPPSSVTSVPTVSFGMARAAGPGDRTHIRALSNPVLPTTLQNVTTYTSPRSVAGAIRIPPSPTSPNFSSSSPNLSTFPATFASMEHVNLFSQAHDYDTECRRLRSLQHHNEALKAARNAVVLRRTILSMNHDYKNVTALARSLIHVGVSFLSHEAEPKERRKV
ncbi:hypothetical protein K435DRAFT_918254, partial [Dendrothele bispora CBS 962.96]